MCRPKNENFEGNLQFYSVFYEEFFAHSWVFCYKTYILLSYRDMYVVENVFLSKPSFDNSFTFPFFCHFTSTAF